ncbi:MAG: hypothetical protein IJ881_10330 [Neisseriaceae bacterium]|nr:hypothetical protein [Neisseriaceae bacterium]MBR3425988.1 hypothetical protein [Neisseriaceae bacterium]
MNANNSNTITPQSESATLPDAKMQPVLLLWALVLMVVLSLTPFLLVKPQDGSADHTLSSLLMWSMSAAFVRGFGFIPQNRFARYLLGTVAAIATTLAALIWRFVVVV